MTVEAAKQFVEQALNEERGDTRNPLVVFEEYTEEKWFGWIFHANTVRYAITGDDMDMAIGLGPIAFVQADASIHLLPTGITPEEAIAEFEQKLRAQLPDLP